MKIITMSVGSFDSKSGQLTIVLFLAIYDRETFNRVTELIKKHLLYESIAIDLVKKYISLYSRYETLFPISKKIR